MAEESGVTRRYARALIAAARQLGVVEEIGDDLQAFAAVWDGQPRFQRVLRAPIIAAARKRELVETAFAGRVNALTLRFLVMLVNRRREDILAGIPAEYQRLAYEIRNVMPAQVTTAVPLSAEERQSLTAALGQRTGKTIELQEQVDPLIMGGAVFRIGDTILDASVQGRLRRLRQRLLAPAVR